MSSLDAQSLPSKVVFAIWIKQMIGSGRATFSKRHKNVIELNAGASSMFAFGRDINSSHPLIAAPKAMIPWFFYGDLAKVIVVDSRNVYLCFGNDDRFFYILIRSNEKRTKCIMPDFELTQDLVKTVDFHGYILGDDGQVELSKAIKRTIISFIKDIEDLIPSNENNPDDWSHSLEQEFDIYDISNFDKLRDPITQ